MRCEKLLVNGEQKMAIPIDPPVPARPDLTVKFAENQPQYSTLPGVVLDGGHVYTRWSFSDDEMKALGAGAVIELTITTGGKPLQPVLMRVEGVEDDRIKDGEWEPVPQTYSDCEGLKVEGIDTPCPQRYEYTPSLWCGHCRVTVYGKNDPPPDGYSRMTEPDDTSDGKEQADDGAEREGGSSEASDQERSGVD